MFTCGQCHVRIYGTRLEDLHFSGSYGPCEYCRKTASCADCHCSVSIKKSVLRKTTKDILDRFVEKKEHP